MRDGHAQKYRRIDAHLIFSRHACVGGSWRGRGRHLPPNPPQTRVACWALLPGCHGCHEAATNRRDAWAALSPFGRGTANWHSRAPPPLLLAAPDATSVLCAGLRVRRPRRRRRCPCRSELAGHDSRTGGVIRRWSLAQPGMQGNRSVHDLSSNKERNCCDIASST